MVKESCRIKAFQFLKQEKEKLSKIENNTYLNFEIQNYLKSKDLTIRQKKLLFKLRSRMIQVGNNYGRKILCPLCKMHRDDQQGLLECVMIKLSCRELYEQENANYQDIFSSDITKLTAISKLMQKCLNTREELIEEKSMMY